MQNILERVSEVNLEFIQEKTEDAIKEKNKITIGYLNHHICNLVYSLVDFRNCFLKFDYIHPDGIGVFLAYKILSSDQKISRFNWTDNAGNFLEFCEVKGHSIYFVGSKTEIIKKAINNIKREFPGLKIVGWKNGFEDLDADIITNINSCSPNILWIGLGSPKQEEWIAKNYKSLNVPIIQAVGDVFRLFSDEKVRGPKFIQKIGLEWFVRLIHNPKQYWKRYLIGIPLFIFRIIKEKLKQDK